MRRLLLVLALALVGAQLTACDDTGPSSEQDMSAPDAGVGNGDMAQPRPDLAGTDLANADLANPQALVPCLDRPDVLPRPPGTSLPCDLIPPTF